MALTLEELKTREASQLHVGSPCLRCGLCVPSFGFGWYTPGDEDPHDLDVIYRECKACWRYSASNPRFDCEEDTTKLPPASSHLPACDCPEGSMACEVVPTGCELHNVPAMTLAPAGMSYVVRPKTRQETRDALDALYERRSLECNAASTVREKDAAWKKLEAVSKLKEKFMWTRLADFRMPPPSPPPQPVVRDARVSGQAPPARRVYTAKIPSGHPYDYKTRRAKGSTSATVDVDDPVADAFYNYAK
ncbi:hypothetical protein B0H13DRAFT_1891538 [Mycena leptocephala]|nr:hypothetical protein B0H13DRAFT_1891538 [Mycena leptocephala]